MSKDNEDKDMSEAIDNRRSGFSVIEILLVLAVIGILGTMGFSYMISARPHAQLEQAEIDVGSVLKSARALAVSEELATFVKFDLSNQTLWVEWTDPDDASTKTTKNTTLPDGVAFAVSGFPASADGVEFTTRGTLLVGGDVSLVSSSGEISTLTGNIATGRFPLMGGHLR